MIVEIAKLTICIYYNFFKRNNYPMLNEIKLLKVKKSIKIFLNVYIPICILKNKIVMRKVLL